jgi:hypothetical protein
MQTLNRLLGSARFAAVGVVAAAGALGVPLRGVAEPVGIVTVTARDFEFDAPAAIDTGSMTLRLVNRGLVRHEVRVMRLGGSHSVRDFERALVATNTAPAWAEDVGGVGATPPGEHRDTTITLTSGRHVLVCRIRLADGGAAVMRGMYRAIDVVPPTRSKR